VRSVPTWRVDEDCFALLLALREKTEEELLIQSRNEPDELISYLKAGHISHFFNDELALRSELRYPRFSRLIHITLKGKEEAVKELEAEISPLLEKYDFIFYSSPDSTPLNTTRYALSRVPSNEWPKPELMEVLRSLPPSVKVEIDPDRLV